MWNLERPPARMHEGQLILPGENQTGTGGLQSKRLDSWSFRGSASETLTSARRGESKPRGNDAPTASAGSDVLRGGSGRWSEPPGGVKEEGGSSSPFHANRPNFT